MWSQGTIGVPNGDGTYTTCRYWVKHYDEPSETYGNNGGRVSNLITKLDGETVCNYDRGWDIEPADDLPTQMAYCILLENYN